MVNTSNKYETVIGLEVHLQFNTATKIFCGCANLFGEKPNTLTCPVCLGLPGSLPVVNKEVLAFGIKVGLALNCQINSFVKFDRKNYYYPDLPKGYQISQFDFPIARDGLLMICLEDKTLKKIRINRAHLEEDAGKLIHDDDINSSLADYNRTGTPLMEIVTEPDLSSPQEAYDYLQNLKLILQYLDVSDCDMEKGSLRCDANISIREYGQKELGTKTELKNLNSFRAVKLGLEYEIKRHQKVIEDGGKIIQESRLWNEEKGVTISMRSKEEAHDYRYFPEPDLLPFTLDTKQIEDIKKELPELPQKKLDRFIDQFNLSPYNANIIVSDRQISEFFEKCIKTYENPKNLCNWINGTLQQELNLRKKKISEIDITPDNLVALIKKVDSDELSNLAGKDVLKALMDGEKDLDEIINKKGLIQVSDESVLDEIVIKLISENQEIVKQIEEGKEKAVGFLVGQAMRISQGKANPKKIGDLIKRRILNG